jgi:uncharacterized delta-60 repeat protein
MRQLSRLHGGSILALSILLLALFATPASAAAGDLDASFGGTGIVTTSFGSIVGDLGRDVAIQADGKIVVVGPVYVETSKTGGDFGLARYQPKGQLDRTFGTGGKVTTDFTGRYGHDEAQAVARYRTDGHLDPAFGKTGKVLTDVVPGGDDEASGLAVQPDGKIVVVGQTRVCDSFGENCSVPAMSLARS